MVETQAPNWPVYREMVTGKIHRATVTGADIDYVGSISVDTDLLEAANILVGQKVDVVDVTNGARLSTYTIPAPAGSGTIQLNGAAANWSTPPTSSSSLLTDTFQMRLLGLHSQQ